MVGCRALSGGCAVHTGSFEVDWRTNNRKSGDKRRLLMVEVFPVRLFVIGTVSGILLSIAIAGFGLLLAPRRRLRVLAQFRMTGMHYDPDRRSALPMWLWRAAGALSAAVGLLYGVQAIFVLFQ
jgi:hypothetical protein